MAQCAQRIHHSDGNMITEQFLNPVELSEHLHHECFTLLRERRQWSHSSQEFSVTPAGDYATN